MGIMEWIRRLVGLSGPKSVSKFEQEHFDKFEAALEECDVRVYVFDDYVRGERLITQGTLLHPVTVHNLVSFHKLNRETRRHLQKQLNAVS